MRWFSAAAMAALLALVTVSSAAMVAVQLVANCPDACSCKNKGGKRTVECVDQALVSVPENVDANTEVLKLSGNHLRILPNRTFSRAGLMDLQKVYLRNCSIEWIDEMAFHGLANLIELDLSKNRLTSVPSHVFHNLPRLCELSVAGNPIQKIEARAFADCPTVTHVDASHCELQSVAERAFEGIVELRTLYINGNHLTELSATVIESLDKLRSVELNDNPWVCDCRVLPVKWLDEKVRYGQPALCLGGPGQLSGIPLADLNVKDLNCRPDVTTDHPLVTAVQVNTPTYNSSPETASSNTFTLALVAFVLGLTALTAFIVLWIWRWFKYPPDAKPMEATGSADGVDKTSYLTLGQIHDHDLFLSEMCDPPFRSIVTHPELYNLPICGTGSACDASSLGSGSQEILSNTSQQHYPADYGLPIIPTNHHLNQFSNTPGTEV